MLNTRVANPTAKIAALQPHLLQKSTVESSITLIKPTEIAAHKNPTALLELMNGY